MKLAISSDHAGYRYKELLKVFLKEKGIDYKDFGTNSEESVDYPDFVHPTCKAIMNKEFDLGILICGSGNGVSITANKYKEIRSAVCWDTKLAELAKKHNDANVLSMPARFITEKKMYEIVNTFLNTNFEGERHLNRVNKITDCL